MYVRFPAAPSGSCAIGCIYSSVGQGWGYFQLRPFFTPISLSQAHGLLASGAACNERLGTSANARESCFQEALNNWAMGTLGEGLSPFKRNASVQP